MRRLLFIIASLFVSGFFLYLVLRDVPIQLVMDQLINADLFWLLMGMVATFMAVFLRGLRWRYLLDDRISVNDSFFILSITSMLNQLPLRAGEVARSIIVTRQQIPVVTAATSIVIERLVDTVLIIVFLSIGLTQVADIPPEATQAASLFGILAVVGFAILLLFARYPNIAHTLLNVALRILPILKRLPLGSMLDNVLIGLKPLTNVSRLLGVLGYSIISWIASLSVLYCLHIALDIQNVDWIVSTLLGASLASFSVAIPVSIASIGPFQAAILLTGQMVGMDEVKAIALGLLFHGVSVLVYIILGIIAFLVLGISLSDIQGKQKTKE